MPPVHHAVSYTAPVHHAVGYGVSNVANTVGIHGVAPAAVPAVHGAYAGAGRYVANSAGTVHVAKREAEADPEALYGAYGYTGLGYGVGYAAPVHSAVSYAAPVHHAVSYAAPVHHAVGYGVSNVANTVGIHGVAPAAVPAVHGAYAGAGRYVANSAGTVHVAKREADAEPEALYGAYGYNAYGLGHRAYSLGYGYGLGYSTLGHGYGYGLGYTHYGYGKRSAEPATAEATLTTIKLNPGHAIFYSVSH